MTDYDEQVRKIVSLKRYETPRDGYFEDFLSEFQQRRRRELSQKSSTALFLERLATWFREIGSIKWVAGAGVAYAAVMVAILMWPAGPGTVPDSNRAPASFEGGQAPLIPAEETTEDAPELKF